MKGVWLEAARHQTGRERFGERFDSSGQLCQSSFCPREKILSVSGSRGWALLPELPAAWHRSCSGTFLLLVFLIFEHLWRCLAHTLTQLVILLPFFPPVSLQERGPIPGAVWTLPAALHTAVNFLNAALWISPKTAFPSLCSHGRKQNIFALLSAHHGKVQQPQEGTEGEDSVPGAAL